MIATPRRIAYIAVSADGYIADRFGSVAWLESFGDATEFGFAEFLGGVDALLMGRRTFDQVMSFGGAWPYGSRPTIVLTRRPLTAAPAIARAADEEETTQALLGAPGRIWIVGGGETLAFCLRRGLVDELHLHVMPILLGEGVPLTGRLHKSTKLALHSSDALGHGVVRTIYTVGDAARAQAQTEAQAEPLAQPLAEPLEEQPFPSEANVEMDA